VISGINHGANMGENVYYSGTVGAAREAALHHIPAVAHVAVRAKEPTEFCECGADCAFLGGNNFATGVAGSVLLNGSPDRGAAACGLRGNLKKITRNQLSEGKDPKGRSYYWIFEQKIDKDIEPDTDYAAVFAGDVSITPLHLDPTDTESLTSLRHWQRRLAAFAKSSKS